MFKKILAFLIKIPYSLVTLMRFLFAPDWHTIPMGSSKHFVKDGQLVSVVDAIPYFLKSIDLAGTTFGKQPKGIMFRGIMPRTTKIL